MIISRRSAAAQWKHYYGNKDLKPQKSNYYSASVEYHASNLQITVTGFYNRIKNMIALTEIPTSAEDRLDEIRGQHATQELIQSPLFRGRYIAHLSNPIFLGYWWRL